MWHYIEHGGKQFGRLTAIKFHHSGEKRESFWEFLCSCNKKKVIRIQDVLSGKTRSCGCLFKEYLKISGKFHIKHGMSRTRFYMIWACMKKRCFNKKFIYYFRYGGKGVVVCNQWLKFSGFMKDMLVSYKNHSAKFGEKNTTLDRISNDGNYSKENCRWATYKEQAQNRHKINAVSH